MRQLRRWALPGLHRVDEMYELRSRVVLEHGRNRMYELRSRNGIVRWDQQLHGLLPGAVRGKQWLCELFCLQRWRLFRERLEFVLGMRSGHVRLELGHVDLRPLLGGFLCRSGSGRMLGLRRGDLCERNRRRGLCELRRGRISARHGPGRVRAVYSRNLPFKPGRRGGDRLYELCSGYVLGCKWRRNIVLLL